MNFQVAAAAPQRDNQQLPYQTLNLTTGNLTTVNNKANHIMANARLPAAGEISYLKLVLAGNLDQTNVVLKQLRHHLNYNTDYYFKWTRSTQIGPVCEVSIEVKTAVDYLEQQSSYLADNIRYVLAETEKEVERVQQFKPLFFSKQKRLEKETDKFNLTVVIDKLLARLPETWQLSYDIVTQTEDYVVLVFHVSRLQ